MKFSFLLVFLIFFSFANAQSINWPASVTDATEQQCNDGEIDLHPPSLGSYTYEWKNSSGSLLGTTEDIVNLSPGEYTVTVTGVNCQSLDMTYNVGIRGYDFEITRGNPSNCTSSKADRDNGFIILEWNQSQSPVPVVEFHDPQQGWRDITSAPYVDELGAGIYRFRITVGSCSWELRPGLCCCSTTYDAMPGDSQACPHVVDGLGFSVSLLREVAASDRNSSDGSITLSVSSPAYSASIRWTGPNGYTGTGQYIDGLAPGQYCYTYTDDCNQHTSGCFDVRSCDEMDLSITIEDKQNECDGDGNGWIQLAVTGEGNPLVYYRGEDGKPTDLIPGGLLENLSGGTYNVILYNDYRCEISMDVSIVNVELERVINRKECKEEFYCEGELYRVVQHPTYFEQDPRYCWLTYEICSLTEETINVIDQSGSVTVNVTTEGGSRCTANITCIDGFTSLGGVLRTSVSNTCSPGASCVTTTICRVGEISSDFVVSTTTSSPASRTRSGTCGPFYEFVYLPEFDRTVRRAYYNWNYRYTCGDGGGSFLCCSNERAQIALTGEGPGNSLGKDDGISEILTPQEIDPATSYISSATKSSSFDSSVKYLGLLLNMENVDVEQSINSVIVTSTPLSTFKLYPGASFVSDDEKQFSGRSNEGRIDELGDSSADSEYGSFRLVNAVGQQVLAGEITPDLFSGRKTMFTMSEISSLGVTLPTGIYFLQLEGSLTPRTVYISE
ncbi:MAG: hypothetical protein AB8F78_11890 [Saprospiraceae bacterium]